MNKNSAIGTSWDEFEKEIFTPEEIAETDLRVRRIIRQIRNRKKGTYVIVGNNRVVPSGERSIRCRNIRCRNMSDLTKSLLVHKVGHKED